MEDALYDEFGNYVGPELSGSSSDDEERGGAAAGGSEDEDDWLDEAERRAAARDEEGGGGGGASDEDAMETDEPSTAVVLAEDKKYYPTAEEVYGPGTEALVEDEDAQPIEEPIIAPIKTRPLDARAPGAAPLQAHAPVEFLAGLMGTPHLTRHVAVAGHLGHGKTALMDMLIEQTHDVDASITADERLRRYTDTRRDEQERECSIKATPMSLVMPGASGKSYLFSAVDCPGHVNFSDEMTAAFRLCDGVLVVVDAVEGVMCQTQRAVKHAMQERLPICLVLAKVDRLILELKLPPADAYHKLRHTIEEVNAIVAAAGGDDAQLLDPAAGNVAFASALYGWSFTLDSFARLYVDVFGASFEPSALAQRLWGDVYFNPATRGFRRKPPPGGGERTFVSFVLEPLYKIYSQAVGEHQKSLERTLSEFGVYLKAKDYKLDMKPLLKLALTRVFGTATGVVDMMVRHLPSAASASAVKAAHTYTGPQDGGALFRGMLACDPRAELMAHAVKLVPKPDCQSFDALTRVMSGTLRVGDRVRVLGEAYSPEDEEDCTVCEVTGLWVAQAADRIPVTAATAGCMVLVEGVDGPIAKTATLVPEAPGAEDPYIFRPLQFNTRSVVKIATEPLNPSDLPKMVDGLRKVNKTFPLAVTKVEESGEHTILGTGEVYLDTLMRDLRDLYSDVEVKVADPVVSFCETCVETSSLKCFAETPNKKNKLTMIAEPLDKGLAEDIERGFVSTDWPKKRQGEFFTRNYDWDLMAARSVWAFGPDKQGPNVLLDDTLPGDVDKKLLNAVKESVSQGFQWGTREGPLCDEPVRNVKFKVLDATIAPEPMNRGGGQMIPTARRVTYSSFLVATPRLMEPIYAVEIQTPADCMSAIYTVLSKRRGHVTADVPVPGTPVYSVKAFLPAIESFGFETDLRYHTQGQAFCQSYFDHWNVVPGDPLDKSVVLRPLEPSPVQALAREFLIKTRRRKGMAETVSVGKFLEASTLADLAQIEGLEGVL